MEDVCINVTEYNASEATEYFIAAENKCGTLYGFCRLRLTATPAVFPELRGCAMIRELHVYGRMQSDKSHVQNNGLGKRLVQRAIDIAKSKGFKKISVISGEGVKQYYFKLGFSDTSNYMIKNL
jgi:histone acetyltransferase (RNA polymerase elongator complex component)